MDLSRVEVVLVRPSRPGNVAAACRAMKNMGVSALSLVGGEGLAFDREARALAYGAWEVLDGARRSASLPAAVAGCTLVAATTGRELGDAWSPRRFAGEAEARARGGRIALVFGPESSGLRRDELDLCHVIVRAPTAPAHSSLNLAQAVLLLLYELRVEALSTGRVRAAEAGEPAAAAGDLERAVAELREALLAIGYLDPANPERILSELRRLLARAGPNARELLLLRGLARQVSWAGRVARQRSGNG
jgi:tRNA/rRNA methyltransferase